MALFETIYPADDQSASLNYKLVKIVRDFRSEQILSTRNDVELRMHGYHKTWLSAGGDEAMRADVQRVLRRMADIGERLKSMGVTGAAVYHGGVAGSSNRAGQIDLYSGSKIDLTLPIAPSLRNNAPGGGQGPTAPQGGKPNLPDAEGSLIIDPADKTLTVQIQIGFDVPGKPATIKSVSVNLKIDERGELSEIGAELKALSAELTQSFARGVVTNVGIAAKAETTYKVDGGKLQAKLKAVLSATFNIPGTKISFDVDASAYVGTPGKPADGAPPGAPLPPYGSGVSVEFTVFKF